jgi:hypothetical protein
LIRNFADNRFDVFDLKINRKRLTPTSFTEEGLPDTGGKYYRAGDPTLRNPSTRRAKFLTLPLYKLSPTTARKVLEFWSEHRTYAKIPS